MNYVLIIVLVFIILLWWVYKWSHNNINSPSDNIKQKTGVDILLELSDIINKTNIIPTHNLNKEEYYMRDYIINHSFPDLCSHPKYLSRDSIIAYREVYEKVITYYDFISPEGRIARRNAEIEEILK